MSKIKVGAAQIPQTTEVEVNTAKVVETMEKAAGEGVELLCLPETQLSGYRVGLQAAGAACPARALDRRWRRLPDDAGN